MFPPLLAKQTNEIPTSRVSKRSRSTGMTLTPGGDTVSCFIRSWRIPIGHDGTDEALEQRNINPSTRTGIFKCEGFTSFTRVENLHHTSFGSVQGLNSDIFCVSIRVKYFPLCGSETRLPCEENRTTICCDRS